MNELQSGGLIIALLGMWAVTLEKINMITEGTSNKAIVLIFCVFFAIGLLLIYAGAD